MAIQFIQNQNGPTLGLSSSSGVGILEQDGCKFKDFDRSGELAPYKDWRNTPLARAEDLAARLSIEELCGLMMYSGHQAVPGQPGPFSACTYDGVPCQEAQVAPWTLSDQQKDWIIQHHHRHFLLAQIENVPDTVQWCNAIQELCEQQPFAIPCNIASDPRHGMDNSAEYNMGSGSVVSQWPEQIGLAATFDPELVRDYGRIVAKEYRALGMTTALGPQIDLATEPRWGRLGGTFGGDPKLATDLARAVCDGYQTTPGTADGWGTQSINAMPKHWPSGGPEEGGRDAHFAYGKYCVYPGNNFQQHLTPFTQGAFQLDGPTGAASAIMPYYTISWEQDQTYGENVGNSYSKYIIADLLRSKYQFTGVVCTDWGITMDPNPHVYDFAHTCWGMENTTQLERVCRLLENGVDQIGDAWDHTMILEAYQKLSEIYGQPAAEALLRASARRILKNIFQTGLFENPYLELEASQKIVACPEHLAAGLQAQQKSVILLKNQQQTLPIPKAPGKKVYVAPNYTPAHRDWFGNDVPESWSDALDPALVAQYYTLVETPEEADFAIVPMRSPSTGTGYDTEDLKNGGNGYMPISLQYEPYTAEAARAVSIAGGDPREDFTNRSYKGKTVVASNLMDLQALRALRQKMPGKPIVVVLQFRNPVIPAEFEPLCDAVIGNSGICAQVILDAISGGFEPSGLLPVQMPANMQTVEQACEDLPNDAQSYVDAQGHAWCFGYGMNWSGVIADARTARYASAGNGTCQG